MYLGSSPAAAPYVVSSKVSTVFYFVYLLLVIPGLGAMSNELLKEAEVAVKEKGEELSASFRVKRPLSITRTPYR